MNIDKIKKLEDLNKELSKLQQQRNRNFEKAKVNFFENNIQEFKDFFIKQGFAVTESSKVDREGYNNKVISAIYNNFKIDVAIPPIDISYMGAYSVWELNVYKDDVKYSLMVNELGHKPSIRTSFTSSINKTLTEDEKMENEIIETKETITMLKEELESNEKTDFGFTLVKEEKERKFCDTQFKSMNDLLKTLFN
ncbi:hypothetical protein HYI07_02170 [Clostridium botulinum]|uniref:hypothetical protein n=1 Tax=Clostridium botulinum TaxID=1491 RepID=UPI0013CB3910|nr:hypothetical protein [Clostridium botulinum]MBD5563526.1 hypothetical protein [Clostridium botulinum]MBD5566928.1 hypothetical protein [Clostridium botulinum]MBD5570459.1 hypothetical protein [Clostridium botulinum]MBD5577825.1 hypothetical protein [Clostridium botulinum]MBD5591755.1 hypothetical protein [Clostridium botulinum]